MPLRCSAFLPFSETHGESWRHNLTIGPYRSIKLSLIRPWDTSWKIWIRLSCPISTISQIRFSPSLSLSSLYLLSPCLALPRHRLFVSGHESLEYGFTMLYATISSSYSCYMQLWYWSLTFCGFVLPSITMNQLLKAQCCFNASVVAISTFNGREELSQNLHLTPSNNWAQTVKTLSI